eukprot:scaffold103041_cov61-Phaeocystis_antarctica.AAC.1
MTDRQDQIFWDAASEPEDDASSFAVGGKGLASAAGAADARKKVTTRLVAAYSLTTTGMKSPGWPVLGTGGGGAK